MLHLYRRAGDLHRVRLGVEHEVVDTVVVDLPDFIVCMDEVARRTRVSGTDAKQVVEDDTDLYFSTSANQNDSWKLVKLPPPGALTSVIEEYPLPTCVVELMATNAFQAHCFRSAFHWSHVHIGNRLTSW